MDKWKKLRRQFVVFSVSIAIFVVVVVTLLGTYRVVPLPIPRPFRNPRQITNACPIRLADQTITPIKHTRHLLVSAYMDQRVKDYNVRIIGMFKRDTIPSLYCAFCCEGQLSNTTPAQMKENPDNFGFTFGTTNVMCRIPKDCSATHVTLLTQQDGAEDPSQVWLPIRNQEAGGTKEATMLFNFTVCISNLFELNNALQYAQTLEMYRLLGVDRVVIYNTSCGPELDRLLQSYSQEGFVEIVPWPIDQYLNPSHGWIPSKDEGDVHYFGQIATLNECIYRSMDRSRYVLLHDIDEIIMPYQHNNLTSLMDMLQREHPKTGVFFVETHNYPKKFHEDTKSIAMPVWRGVPGFNILERIYKWEPDRSTQYNPYKLIVQPRTPGSWRRAGPGGMADHLLSGANDALQSAHFRGSGSSSPDGVGRGEDELMMAMKTCTIIVLGRMVEQTSVHLVLETFGEQFWIPPDLCHIIHSRLSIPYYQPLEKIQLDTRLWDFQEELVPNVNNMLRRAGLLRSVGQR